MIFRLAPWQRINIALARGILLKASGNMRWTARITAFGVKLQDVQNFDWMGEADSEMDAARLAAEASARRIYGDKGTAGFLNTGHAPLYLSTIGLYDGGITRGCSIEMLILKYTHPVTGK